jgi:hypothetical protein
MIRHLSNITKLKKKKLFVSSDLAMFCFPTIFSISTNKLGKFWILFFFKTINLTNFANFWGKIHQIVDNKKTGERERKKQTFLVVNFIFWELHGTFPNLNFKYCFKLVFFPPKTCMAFFFLFFF